MALLCEGHLNALIPAQKIGAGSLRSYERGYAREAFQEAVQLKAVANSAHAADEFTKRFRGKDVIVFYLYMSAAVYH